MLKEVLTVNVDIKEEYEVKGQSGSAKMILFEGYIDCDVFKGKIMPGGVDTQRQKPGENVTLSARYIVEGTDNEGKECKLFIENNGEILEDGTIVTKPVIYTDSEALSYIEKAELTGTVEASQLGVIIHIYTNL